MIDAKEYLIEILEYYVYRLKTGGCTMDEVNSATEALENNMRINGAISDFAKFYGKPETTVRTTIFKKLFSKPKRAVLYPFHEFIKIVPDKWRKDR